MRLKHWRYYSARREILISMELNKGVSARATGNKVVNLIIEPRRAHENRVAQIYVLGCPRENSDRHFSNGVTNKCGSTFPAIALSFRIPCKGR